MRSTSLVGIGNISVDSNPGHHCMMQMEVVCWMLPESFPRDAENAETPIRSSLPDPSSRSRLLARMETTCQKECAQVLSFYVAQSHAKRHLEATCDKWMSSSNTLQRRGGCDTLSREMDTDNGRSLANAHCSPAFSTQMVALECRSVMTGLLPSMRIRVSLRFLFPAPSTTMTGSVIQCGSL